ncbi:hypothetical protein ABK040_002244 [Willaertia magna]
MSTTTNATITTPTAATKKTTVIFKEIHNLKRNLIQTLLFVDLSKNRALSLTEVIKCLEPFISIKYIQYHSLDENKMWVRLLGCDRGRMNNILLNIQTDYVIYTYLAAQEQYGLCLPLGW